MIPARRDRRRSAFCGEVSLRSGSLQSGFFWVPSCSPCSPRLPFLIPLPEGRFFRPSGPAFIGEGPLLPAAPCRAGPVASGLPR